MMNNTLEVETPELEEVETPEEAETVETEEVEDEEETEIVEDTQDEEPVISFMGRQYSSMDEAEQQYREMQKRATKAEQELKAHKKQVAAEKQMEDFKNLDPDEKLEWLAQKQLEEKELEAEVDEAKDEQASLQAEAKEVESFTKTHPYLKAYPTLAKQFRRLAMLPEYKEYTLESIFDVEFKPLIDDLGGKKVKVTRKKAPGKTNTQSGFTQEQIKKMTPAEYEKNRSAILAQMNTK